MMNKIELDYATGYVISNEWMDLLMNSIGLSFGYRQSKLFWQ
jgi:hypothetical protein